MQNTSELSETKQILLEKLLRGELPKTPRVQIVKPMRGVESRVPLSFPQQQLWLLAQLIPAIPVYNECVTVHLPGPLDVTILERSLNEMIRRHDSWRTCFPPVDSEPIQVVQESFTLPISFVDLRHFSPVEREAEALCLAKTDALLPFDLATDPLLRAILVRLDDEQHKLFLTLHHIIFDGLSIYQVFLPELRAIYEAFVSNQPSPLEELSTQYVDFTLWHRDWLQGESSPLSAQLDYWKKQLAGAPALLALPIDHPRPVTPSYQGTIYQATLSEDLTNALRDLSRKEGVTLYSTLLAAFNTLLYRYTGQDDIPVGTASGGRKRSEFQQLLGVFINMLVLRTRMTNDLSFRDLLHREQDLLLEAQANQDIPFEVLVKELQPERNAGQNPLFQALLLLEPPVATHPSGWTVTHMEIETGTAKFDLSLIIEDRPGGFVYRFEYSTDLFDASTIARMAGHWHTLLQGIVRDSSQTIGQLPLLTEAERQQLLVEWNDTTTDYPGNQCIHQLFEAQVEQTPNTIAVVFGNEQLTYRELNRRANQLAHFLQRLGVGPEVLVGLRMERSLEMVVALLGILKAGGAYVPFDLAYPQDRIAFMLQDAQVSVLLTQQRLASQIPESKASVANVISLDTQWNAIAQQSDDNLDLAGTINSENLAYVMYTSGSTGTPKGVAIEHHSVVRLVKNTNYATFSADEVFLQFAPIAFDASTLEIWAPLLNGGRLIVSPARLTGPDEPGAILRRYHVTTLWLTAGLFHHMVELHLDDLCGIRQLLAGGDVLSPSHVQRVLQALPHCLLINGYGPTENTTFTTCFPMTAATQIGSTVPIGRPIANTQVYILDSHLQPVPVGVSGELYIGGDGLARGYLRRPDLTKERFVPNPFSGKPGVRMYKTGDLARYLPDGSIEFLGRIDHQVKIRGFRIELGEIEEVLKRYPGVRQAIVVAREESDGDKHLVAYVLTTPAQSLAVNTLRGYLQEKLPTYMVPSAIMLLDALPLTPNGKIDRKALPAPDYAAVAASSATQPAADDSFTVPLMTIHHQLVRIWEELLHVHPIGIKDNFFDLGGHSLLAARLLVEVERVSGKKLPISTFFAGATIEHLANAILGDEETRSRAPAVAIQAGGRKPPFFFLHGDWIGGGFYCLELARSLGADQPFYVLEPYNFFGLPIPPSLKEVAAAHIASIRAVQPEGPYYFGGFCNGGLIAYEMARQLAATGQTVALLLLVDPAMPTSHKKVREYITRIGATLKLSKAAQVDWFLRYLYVRMPHFRERFMGSEHLEEVAEIELGRTGNVPRSLRKRLNVLPPRASVLRQQWSGIYRWVAAGYIPGSYTASATFLWSSDEHHVFAHYKHKAKKAEVQVIPGTHMGWKTQNLVILAEKMRTYLSSSQQTSFYKEQTEQ